MVQYNQKGSDCMCDFLLYIRDWLHDTIYVWFRDVVLWKFQEKRITKFFKDNGIIFDEKEN